MRSSIANKSTLIGELQANDKRPFKGDKEHFFKMTPEVFLWPLHTLAHALKTTITTTNFPRSAQIKRQKSRNIFHIVSQKPVKAKNKTKLVTI